MWGGCGGNIWADDLFPHVESSDDQTSGDKDPLHGGENSHRGAGGYQRR